MLTSLQDEYNAAYNYPTFLLQQRVADVLLNVSTTLLFILIAWSWYFAQKKCVRPLPYICWLLNVSTTLLFVLMAWCWCVTRRVVLPSVFPCRAVLLDAKVMFPHLRGNFSFYQNYKNPSYMHWWSSDALPSHTLPIYHTCHNLLGNDQHMHSSWFDQLIIVAMLSYLVLPFSYFPVWVWRADMRCTMMSPSLCVPLNYRCKIFLLYCMGQTSWYKVHHGVPFLMHSNEF